MDKAVRNLLIGYKIRRTLFALSLICLGMTWPVAAQVTISNTSGTSSINGLTITGGIAPTSGTTGSDILWSDSSDGRLKVNNHNTAGLGSEDLAVWPCRLTPGGIVYGGPTTQTSFAISEENCLGPGTTPTGVPLLLGSVSGSPTPQWGGTYLDLQGNALVSEIQNSSTATISSQLVVLVNTSGTAQVALAGTSNTTGIEGICVAGCGGAAGTTALIAKKGNALCLFDGVNAPTAGHFVQASTTVAGACRDVTLYPANGRQLLGRVLTSGAINTPQSVSLYGSGEVPQNVTSQGSCTNRVLATLDNLLGPTCTTITSSYVDSSIAPTSSPSLVGTPIAPTAASTTNSTQIATTAFVKSSIYSTWSPIQPGNLTGTGSFAQWTLPAGITAISLDVDLATAPLTCGTNGVFAIYDQTASTTVFSVTFANGQSTYSTTGSVLVASGHILRTRMTTAAGTCGTNPQNALVTLTYQMQ